MNIVAYTYLIGWTVLDRYYYGVRYAAGCNTNELWVKYFTSSDIVKTFRKIHGEPDLIQVRKVFEDGNKAMSWEANVLKRMKVVNDPRFLNMNDRHAPPINNRIMLDSTKNKIRNNRLGIKLSETTKQKIREARAKQTNIGMRGKKLSVGTIERIRAARAKQIISEETKQKMRESHLGIKHSIVECPVCGKTGGSRAMKRYHFDNCRGLIDE